MRENVCAIILAAGSGSRMNSNITKQQMTLCGKSVLAHTLMVFDRCESVRSIVVVARADELDFARGESIMTKKTVAVVAGGRTRAESARIGFNNIPVDTDFIAIHDAARCLVTPDDVARVIEAAIKYGAATATTAVSDTVKIVDSQGYVRETVDRDRVRLAATPQIFRTDIYRHALEIAKRDGICVTDDNMIVENAGYEIFCVDTGNKNIKITHTEDLDYAEFVLKRREDHV